jgi:uncharacterized protein DUF2628
MKACPFCAEEIQDAAIVCKHCHRDLTTPTSSRQRAVGDDKYQELFALFDANGGTFKLTWNWAALLFGPEWYLVKGMFVKAILQVIVVVFTAGIGAPFVWIYAGLAGNFDLYVLQREGKQLW